MRLRVCRLMCLQQVDSVLTLVVVTEMESLAMRMV